MSNFVYRVTFRGIISLLYYKSGTTEEYFVRRIGIAIYKSSRNTQFRIKVKALENLFF